MYKLRIAKEFSNVPAGRFRRDGPKSGEIFREDVLAPLLRSEVDGVSVVLDGVEGYGSSFLEEAFGGLVRVNGFSFEELQKKLVIVAETPSFLTYRDEIWEYIKLNNSSR
jgi:hypothetical protein